MVRYKSSFKIQKQHSELVYILILYFWATCSKSTEFRVLVPLLFIVIIVHLQPFPWVQGVVFHNDVNIVVADTKLYGEHPLLGRQTFHFFQHVLQTKQNVMNVTC